MSVDFDHRTAGTPAQAWRDARAALPPLEPPEPGQHLLVLAAHPDDETLGAGGLIAQAARAGVDVAVAVASDGEASHPDSPTHGPAELARIRRGEVRAALAELGPAVRPVHLGFPDGRLTEHLDPLTAKVAALADRIGATHVVTPWRGDRHPDHEACALAGEQVAARRGAHRWQFPVWAWHWAAPGDAALPLHTMRALPLSDEDRQAKSRAVLAYASQHRPLSDRPGDEAILPPDVLAHFADDRECFVVAAPAGSPSYFDALYERDPDPWGLRDRFYEQRKRAILLASLPRPRFRRAFEPGCATGLLTEELARRCDRVVAWDVAPAAVRAARDRVAEAAPGRIRVERGAIPGGWPDGVFDLVVLSEVGYYCADLRALARQVLASLSDDGVVVACHWRRPAPDHPQSADAVHAALDTALTATARHVEDDFLLGVWSRSGRSVAEAEGLVG